MAKTKTAPELQRVISVADERIKFHKTAITQLETFKATAPVLFSMNGSGDVAPRRGKSRRHASGTPITTSGKRGPGRPKGSKNKKTPETPNEAPKAPVAEEATA